MKLRRNFLPKNLQDWASFGFITVVIPIFYWFEMFLVLQEFYPFSSVWYWIHFICGSFITMNVVSNLLAVMFIDTSISSVDMSTQEDCINWSHCDKCHLSVPPRCWHCYICDRCILKRDHHCTFSGCCIGHVNHRFFIMFLSYFFIACCYALYLNLYYILPRVEWDLNVILQITMPILLILLDGTKAYNHLLMIFLVLNLVGLALTGVLLRFHLRLVFKGSVSYEDTRNITKYNYGHKQNIRNIFGERWYLVWISPFVHSSLTLSGIHWDVESNVSKTKFM